MVGSQQEQDGYYDVAWTNGLQLFPFLHHPVKLQNPLKKLPINWAFSGHMLASVRRGRSSLLNFRNGQALEVSSYQESRVGER